MPHKFLSRVRVIYADTDAMGIVYHMNYIKFFEIGRTELLREMKMPYTELEDKGIWITVTGLDLTYKSSARYDDLLEITTWIEKLRGASFEVKYEIRKQGDPSILVTGATRHAFTDSSLAAIKVKKEYPEIYEVFWNAFSSGAL